MVKFIPPPVFSVMSDSSIICKGDTVSLSASGGDKYQWFPVSDVMQPTAPSTKAVPRGNTAFQVIITESNCGISDTLSTTVSLKALPVVSLSKSNDIDCSVPYTTLTATGGGISYSWKPQESLSNPYISNPVASPGETTAYICAVQGGNSCISFDTLKVNVTKINQVPFLMPNAFTPNGDGLNDCFGVRGRGLTNNMVLSVYNRFGGRIFSTADPSRCWDGKYQGIPQDSGTFVYTLEIDGLCGREVHKGTVLLIR